MRNRAYVGPSYPKSTQRESRSAQTLQSLRETLMRFAKAPLLASYTPDWVWPQNVDPGPWENVSIASRSGASLAGLYADCCS